MAETPPKSSPVFRLEAASDSPAAELDEQYRGRLCQLVEREMNRRFRRKEDPEDVVQSAFRTFYRRNALGEFQIDSSVDLWRLLETITRRKILKHVEKLGAGKRDPRREECMEGDDLRGQGPTPEEAAIAADLVEKTLAGLDETYMQVLHLRLKNCTEEEIAAALGCNRAFVRTRLNHLRERLQRLSDDDPRKPMEPGDLLRQCLAAPASDYLRGLGPGAVYPWPTGFAADSPAERTAADMTLSELFQCPDSPLGLLIAVKRCARRLMGPGASDRKMDFPVRPRIEVHQLVYFASIAAAMVRGERISKSSSEALRVACERLAADAQVDEWLRRLFETAQERFSGQGSAEE
jgi:RNA polymerase sigma-70 factor (ECF subfamily)